MPAPTAFKLPNLRKFMPGVIRLTTGVSTYGVSVAAVIGIRGCSVIMRKRVGIGATCSVVYPHVDPKDWGVYVKTSTSGVQLP
jgi:hypothetical protein